MRNKEFEYRGEKVTWEGFGDTIGNEYSRMPTMATCPLCGKTFNSTPDNTEGTLKTCTECRSVPSVEAIQKQKEDNQAELDKLNKYIHRLYEDKDAEEEPIEKMLEEVRQKWQPQIEEQEELRKLMEQQDHKLHYKRYKATAKAEVLKALEKDKMDEMDYISLLEYNDIHTGESEDTQLKTPLKNGIVILKTGDYDYTRWYAFDGTRLIGLCHRRKGRHPGDETIPFSFIGNLTQVRKQEVINQYRIGGKYHKQDGYREWKKDLENMTPADIKTIPFTEDVVKGINRKDFNGQDWDW